MQELIWKFLIGPIIADAQNVEELAWNGVTAFPGYNPVNTAVYAASAILLIYLAYSFLEEKSVNLDARTAFYSIPFMFMGGTLRFLEDAQVVPYPYNILLITPLVYILVASLYLPSLYIFERERILYAGTVFLLPVLVLSFTGFQALNLGYVLAVLALSSALSGLYYIVFSGELVEKPLIAVAASQFFEGAASMFAVSRGFQPKQLLASAFTSIFGAAGILLMKVSILALAIYLVRDLEGSMKGIALIVLYGIGFGTGFRVFLRVAAGV